EVAQQAIEEAVAGTTPHDRHLGYYLVGEGRHAFGRRLGYRPRWRDALPEALKRWPNTAYFGLLALFTALGLAGAAALVRPGAWWLLALALLPAAHLAV